MNMNETRPCKVCAVTTGEGNKATTGAFAKLVATQRLQRTTPKLKCSLYLVMTFSLHRDYNLEGPNTQQLFEVSGSKTIEGTVFRTRGIKYLVLAPLGDILLNRIYI